MKTMLMMILFTATSAFAGTKPLNFKVDVDKVFEDDYSSQSFLVGYVAANAIEKTFESQEKAFEYLGQLVSDLESGIASQELLEGLTKNMQRNSKCSANQNFTKQKLFQVNLAEGKLLVNDSPVTPFFNGIKANYKTEVNLWVPCAGTFIHKDTILDGELLTKDIEDFGSPTYPLNKL